MIEKMKDAQVVEAAEVLIAREREILAEVLNYLREIQRRRLFTDYGYKSLHEICVKHFKYSDDQEKMDNYIN